MISTAPFLPTIDDVCLEALRLPCSPALLPRLSDALQNEASSTGDISDIIQIDPALASATLPRLSGPLARHESKRLRMGTQ